MYRSMYSSLYSYTSRCKGLSRGVTVLSRGLGGRGTSRKVPQMPKTAFRCEISGKTCAAEGFWTGFEALRCGMRAPPQPHN